MKPTRQQQLMVITAAGISLAVLGCLLVPELLTSSAPLENPTREEGDFQEAAGRTQKISPVDGSLQVYIPAGSFRMGSTLEDPFYRDNEYPQRTVYLDGFWMDQTEVTNAMFAKFLNQEGNQIEGGDTWLDADDPASQVVYEDGAWRAVPGYEDHPAVEVTWYGARSYCQWANRRLPTEAEWEKAARGEDARTFPWGEGEPGVVKIPCERSNLAGCHFDTQPVGSYPDDISPYGVLDMAGNIAEWVSDWYQADYYRTAPSSNPQGPQTGTYKVLRGGSWTMSYLTARTANRFWTDPSFACYYHGEGFRCAESE